jgi:hypothetical protein
MDHKLTALTGNRRLQWTSDFGENRFLVRYSTVLFLAVLFLLRSMMILMGTGRAARMVQN